MSLFDSLLNIWHIVFEQNKKEKFSGAAKNSAVKAQRYMDSRSDVRQVSVVVFSVNLLSKLHFPVT
jgi:hypothetical protein